MSHTLIPLENPSWDPRDQDFQICSGNWPGAEEAPELLEELIQEELTAGYLEPVPSLDTAQQRWDQVAVGKANVVQAAGPQASFNYRPNNFGR